LEEISLFWASKAQKDLSTRTLLAFYHLLQKNIQEYAENQTKIM